MPFYRVYEPQEYQGHRQNWAITQDENGTMYFANEGLLIFNGEDWQLETVPNQRHLRSLDCGHDRIYVGGSNELGFFKKNGASYEFTSHVQHVPDSLKQFDRVWTTLVHQESVYYQTDIFVLRVSLDGTSKLWPFTKNNVWKLLLLDDTVHIDVPKEGFFALGPKDRFELIPNGELLKWVGMEYFIPLEQGWLFEQRDTLKVFNGKNISLFKNEASDIFQEYGLDNGIKTKAGDLVFSTRRKGGVVILNEDGTLKDHLKSDSGFSNEIIRNLYEDQGGSIWFALNTGVSRMDLSSPLRFYTSEMGLDGTTFAIQRFNNILYVGTSDGLKILNGSEFEHVAKITSIVQDLEVVQDHLIVATSRDKLYAIDSLGRANIIDISKTASKGINLQILTPMEDTNSFISLFEQGVFQVKWNGAEWKVQQQLSGHFQDANEFIQSKPGVLWVDAGVNGIYRIDYATNSAGQFEFGRASLKHYGRDRGVPQGIKTISKIGDSIIIHSSKTGTYFTYRPVDDKFSPIHNLKSMVGITDSIIEHLGRKSGYNDLSTWFETSDGKGRFLINSKKKEAGFGHIRFPLNSKVAGFSDPRGANTFYPENDRVFFGGIKGMVEYNTAKAGDTSNKTNIFLTSMATSDTTYFELSKRQHVADIKFNNSKLSFTYTSTSYKDAENKTYQYKLEGFDKEWSLPSGQSRKEYTSLPSGEYTFKVKALNDYFVESPEATVNFTVKRPWYWNSIAIATYILLLGLFIYLISHWRNRTLRLKNLQLETAVNKAIAETQRQADEISHLYEVKNRFFSNISHELRTPLTLILGPSSDLMEDKSMVGEQKNKITFINNNAKRLLRLINQLLDLSKLEAGKLDLRASQQDIVKLVSTITESFSSMAASQGIDLSFNSDEEHLYVFYDSDKLEKVLVNLLSNAMKFTESKGTVVVSLSRKNNSCLIQVKDSGIGINQEQLPYIFDRFFQADNSKSREHEGTGIGLSLTRELVELHGGTIAVQSTLGNGSEFIVQLPLGKEHLKEHQLAPFKPVTPKRIAPVAEPLIPEENLTIENPANALVLLVEDNTEMRAYIKMQLGDDYQIVEAENGMEGMEIAITQVPDLIISDVMMPKMDGTELCKKIKSNDVTSHIPIVLLTAKASEEDKIKGLNIQADAYLAKPFNKMELKAQVNNLIVNRKKLQRRFATSAIISPKDIAVTSMEQLFLEKLVDEIEKNIGNETYGVEEMATAINLSRSQLHRKMISITNQTPSLFIRKYRLERAKKLLEQGAGRVSDIAFQVGFSSPSYFTKCFVEEFGITPKETTK